MLHPDHIDALVRLRLIEGLPAEPTYADFLESASDP